MEPAGSTALAIPVQESTPLLAKTSPKVAPQVVPMGYGDIWKAMETAQKAFLKDPLAAYFDARRRAADKGPFRLARQRFALAVSWLAGIGQQSVLTIDGGVAFLKYSTPEKEDPWYVGLVLIIVMLFSSAETRTRRRDYGTLLRAVAQETFGDKLHESYKIIGLGTDPEVQGRGYGSALMKHVLEQSDIEGRDCCLVTTDAHRFYESLGFSIVRTAAVGANVPTWHGEPITLRIMHRPAKTPGS